MSLSARHATRRASSSYESQHLQFQQERARNNGIALMPLESAQERDASARPSHAASQPQWPAPQPARAATHVQPTVAPVHKSGPDLSLLNIALTAAAVDAAHSNSSAATPRSIHQALPSVRSNKRSDALGSSATASAPPTARSADLPPAGSGRWSAQVGPPESAPGVAALQNSATARFLLERAAAHAQALAAAGGVAAPASSSSAPQTMTIANDSIFGLSSATVTTAPTTTTFETMGKRRHKSRFSFNQQTASTAPTARAAPAARTESPRQGSSKVGPAPSPASVGSRSTSNAGTTKQQPLASPRTDRLDHGHAAKFPAVAGAIDAPRPALAATAPPAAQQPLVSSMRRTNSVVTADGGPSFSLSLTIPQAHTGTGFIVPLSPMSNRLDLSAVSGGADEKEIEAAAAAAVSESPLSTQLGAGGRGSTSKRKDFRRGKSLTSRRIAAFLRDAVKNSLQAAASPPVSPRPQPVSPRPQVAALQRKASDLSASSTSLGSMPAMQRRGSNVASTVSMTSSTATATGATAGVTSASAALVSSQSAAQQAHNLLTMQDLLAEAWKLHARRSSFLRHDSQSSSSDVNAPSTRGIADHAHAISPSLRAERAANMTRFIHEVWHAILRDKTDAGVGITETHRLHAAARFERLFRREHDGAEAHTLAHPRLALVASGIGPHAGKVVAKYFAQQAHYTELDLARNQLGDAGIKPLLKLLRRSKNTNSGGTGATSGMANGAAVEGVAPLASKGGSTVRVGRSGRNTDVSVPRRAASSSPSQLRKKPRARAATVRTGSVPPPQSRAAAVAASLARQSSLRSVAGGAVPPPPPPLRRLNLSYNSLSPVAFESIAAALPTSSLRMLDLSSDHASDLANRMGESGARALAAALASLTCPLQDLRLAGVGSQGFRILMSEGLGKAAMYSQLQSLDVRGNWLSADAFVMLMKAARRGMVHLAVLRLARNRFSMQGAQCLFDYVRSTTALKILDLSMCCISTTAVGQSLDAQGQAHGAAVHGPATDSSGNTQQPSAGREFCFQLLEAMARNPSYCSIEDLSLDENALGDLGSRQIGLALALLNAHLPNLKSLSLVACNIADTQWLSYGLSRNTTLTRLNLSANPIGDGGTIALALGLQGRLELDAPLVPILALRRRDGAAGYDEQEEAEEERATAAIAEAARQVELEAEAKRVAEQAAQRREADSKAERKMLLQDALKDGDSLLLEQAAPQLAASEPEPGLDLLADATLKQASAATAASAAREKLRLGATVPAAAPPSTLAPGADSADLDGPPRPRNVFWDLSSQQLNSARMQNARRVIVYSKRAHPISAMSSLNLTHTSMGDVGLIHLAQVISLNHALVSLSVPDNDLTSAGGLAMLNTLKAIQPKDTGILRVLDLSSNRISSALEGAIDRITSQRKRSHDVQRVRAYKSELSSSKQNQRARLAGYIVSIKASMDADEAARRKLAAVQDDYARVQAEENAETAKLQAELDAILRDQRDLYTSQLPSYEDLVVRRVGAVLHANTQRTEELTQALRAERTATAKISRKIDREIRPAMEQVRAEITLDHRPLLQLLDSETKLLAGLRSKLGDMKAQKAQMEATILDAYYAILRNSGRGSSKGDEPLDPELRAPELYRSVRVEVEKLQQASTAAAAGAESGLDPVGSGSSVAVPSSGENGTNLPTAVVSTSSRVFFDQFSPSVSRRSSGGPLLSGSSTTLPSPFLTPPPTPPRKKHSLFFGAEGAAIDQENEAREIEQRQRAAYAPVLSHTGRPLTPRMGTALRYLSRWGEQAERAAIQHALIHVAQTSGRPIDKIMPATGPRSGALDLGRLTPRSRSAVQRLRGDLQTEWEMKRAQEEREARVRKRQEGGVPAPGAKKNAPAARPGSARRKSRALGSAVPAASSAANDDFDSFDGDNLSVSIDLVTSLLQLGPLTKIQGSTTLYAMAMKGFQRGDSVYVALVHSADTERRLKEWESKYGTWNATTGKRVPPPVSQLRAGANADASPPLPLTMSCSTSATSSVLIKLVSEKLDLPISAISSLSFLEKRSDEHANAAAATAAAQAGTGGSSDLVRLIRERELKEVSAKKKKQAEMKQQPAAVATAAARKSDSGGGSRKKNKKRSNTKKINDPSAGSVAAADASASSAIAAASSSVPIFTPQPSSLRTLSTSSRAAADGVAVGSSASSQRASYDPSAYDALTKHHSSVDGHAAAASLSHSITATTPLLRPSPPITAAATPAVTPRSKMQRATATSEESKEPMSTSVHPGTAPATSSRSLASVSNLRPFGTNDLSAPPAAQQSAARLSNRRR